MKLSTKIKITLRHLLSKPFQTVALVLSIAFGTALGGFLFLFTDGFQQGLVRAVEPFEIMVGTKGSPYQMVLSSVFLQDAPLGNVSWQTYAALSDDSRVDYAIPVAMGDNYRGFPIIGTTEALLKMRVRPSDPLWFRIKEGEMFKKTYDVVLGAQTAAITGLKIGDKFRSIHGFTPAGGHEHEDDYTVTGIAESVQGPYDRAIFTPISSIWESHSHGEHGDECGADCNIPHEHTHVHSSDMTAAHEHVHENCGPDCQAQHEHEHTHPTGDVTMIWVHPVSYFGAYSLAADYQRETGSQLVFPAQTTVRLFSMLGRSEKFLSMIVWAVTGITVLITLLVLYWSGASRTRERLLLRVLGASHRDLISIAWLEGVFPIITGVLTGWGAGRLAGMAAFELLKDTTALHLAARFTEGEILLCSVLFIGGSLAAIVPAYFNNRSTLEKLMSGQ